jgi:sugar phosphate isomerase/epimerase
MMEKSMSTRPLTALDNWFYHPHGSYSFEAKNEILAELGFAGINYTLWSDPAWADVPRFGSVKERFGIEVSGVYAAIGGPNDIDGIARVAELLRSVEGTTQVELAVIGSDVAKHNSDPAGDPPLITVLASLLSIAEKRGITIALYPHSSCWLETLDDGIRLCKAIDHPNLKLVFSSYHWFVARGPELQTSFANAMPYLNSVNICGSRRMPSDNGLPATVELIDQGAIDNFFLLGALRQVGFTGTIALQGYAVAGDAYANLRHSIAAFRDIEKRVDQHDAWLELRHDPLPSATGTD